MVCASAYASYSTSLLGDHRLGRRTPYPRSQLGAAADLIICPISSIQLQLGN